VASARAVARSRGVEANVELRAWQVEVAAPLDADAQRLVERALRAGRLTGRGLAGIRRVALTIADLVGHEPPLTARHVSMALALRTDPSFLLQAAPS
jgi:magnesium chelatase family protein